MSEKHPNIDAHEKKVLLSAFGIHAGGGLVLLKALVKGLGGSLKVAAFDSRCNFDASLPLTCEKIVYVRRSFIARVLALARLARMTCAGNVLLCFNSLPPLKKPKGRVVIFVQAPHFFGAHRGIRYSSLTTLRINIERLWFKLGIQNCDEIWVQTALMQETMQRQYPNAVISVVPLVDDELAMRLEMCPTFTPKQKVNDSEFAFFYPADAVGHKNHKNLLKAWGILVKEGRNPLLFLTLRRGEMDFVQTLAPLDGHALKYVINLGWLSREEVLKQISKSSALIFPSQAETFGLPMLEARALDIPVVASERDFVRNVCMPLQTFDPDSPRSIAMAVLRFMDGDLPLATSYYSAEQFVKRLVS